MLRAKIYLKILFLLICRAKLPSSLNNNNILMSVRGHHHHHHHNNSGVFSLLVFTFNIVDEARFNIYSFPTIFSLRTNVDFLRPHFSQTLETRIHVSLFAMLCFVTNSEFVFCLQTKQNESILYIYFYIYTQI
jgi:hypothetical protein